MNATRQHPLSDLGKGLRDRLDNGLNDPSERMHELLQRLAGLPSGQEGSESRENNEGSGA